MIDLFISSLLFFSPAFIGNMAPVIFKDLGLLMFLDKPISVIYFGEHKSYRGFVAAMILGLAYSVVFAWFLPEFFVSKLGVEMVVVWGLSLSFGALLGDLVKSFCKRKFGRKPGEMWFPWDQIDLVIGSYICGLLWFEIPVLYFVVALLVTPILHLGVNFLAYKLKLKEVPW